MEVLIGYLWKTTGSWEQRYENGWVEEQVRNARFLVFHEDGGGGAYVLTADDEMPSIRWGEIEEWIPEATQDGCDLKVLDYDEGSTVWIGEADGECNAVVLVVS